MNDFIFTPVKLLKKDFYTWLKQTLIDNGWQNISSRPATENDIFYSKGESNNENIFFRMKEYYGAQTTTTISASIDIYLPVAPLRSYTPGINGAAGVMVPNVAAANFYNNRIAAGGISINTEMTIYYHCNKDRIVFIVEWPSYSELHSTFHLFGKTFRPIAKKPMTTQTVVLSGYSYGTVGPYIASIADINMSTTAIQKGDFNYFSNLKPKNPSGKYFMSELCITNDTDGFHSMVDGIYAINNDTTAEYNIVLKGDELVDNQGRVYRITSIVRSHTNYPAVPFPLIAFRIQ
ncbi:virion structural protein [Bacillus phage G]|uniref:Gp372 n=1 Tax=Bacillus phage G TaxID=2884420 RepID=G3MAB3_9CAUD|nr:virion structural protein [Bacillus phage G]AEO93631.1 gp372 [Bacillus phage G]